MLHHKLVYPVIFKWRIPFLGSSPQITFTASYATVDGQNGNKMLPIRDDQWPQLKEPSPYDIFGISKTGSESAKLDTKSLKKKYHRYVKLYHPDHSDNIMIFSTDTVTDSSSKSPLLLTSSEKRIGLKWFLRRMIFFVPEEENRLRHNKTRMEHPIFAIFQRQHWKLSLCGLLWVPLQRAIWVLERWNLGRCK